MGEFQSGQMGQTVNLLSLTSVVRIHLPPPIERRQSLRSIFSAHSIRRTVSAGDFGGSNPPSPTKNELMKVSSFFLFCSGLENVSDTPVAYQSRSAACVEITLSSFYHKSKNIELPLGWLDIFFLSIFCVSVLFRGGAFSFSAAGISRRTGIGGVRRGQTEENDCRGMLASTKNLSAISRYHKNLAMSRINLQDSCYN